MYGVWRSGECRAPRTRAVSCTVGVTVRNLAFTETKNNLNTGACADNTLQVTDGVRVSPIWVTVRDLAFRRCIYEGDTRSHAIFGLYTILP